MTLKQPKPGSLVVEFLRAGSVLANNYINTEVYLNLQLTPQLKSHPNQNIKLLLPSAKYVMLNRKRIV